MNRFTFCTLAVIGFMLIFIWRCKVYDLATGTLFTLCLGLLRRMQLGWFTAVFAVSCLNRETSFLLTLVFSLYLFGQISFNRLALGVLLQGAIFLSVRLWLWHLYSGNAGADAVIDPLDNLQIFARMPWESWVHWSVMAMIAWRVLRQWKLAPSLWQLTWLTMFPLLLVMYLVFGAAFEVRVFAELWPVVVGIGFQRLVFGLT